MPQLLGVIRSSSFYLTGNQCIPSKCSLLLENVRERQPVFVYCSLPSDEEMKGMKVGILVSFQSRLRFVGLRWFFTRRIFPI